MAYNPPTIDATGVVIPSYQDIVDKLIEDIQGIYGKDIYLANDSQDYQLISTFALMFYDLCQSVVLDYNSHNINTATGVSLDRIAANLGIKRAAGVASVVELTCTGDPNTLVTYASAQDVNGYVWQMETEFTIPASGEVKVFASCVENGAIQAPIGTINIIRTPTVGWKTVTNETPASVGSETETDEHLRIRLEYAAARPANSIFEGMVSELQALSNVIRVKGYENFTSEYKDGLPPHSVAFVVEGGDERRIAETILDKKTPGTDTFGNTSVDIVDTDSGQTLTISFSRPEYKNINVSIDITSLPTYNETVQDDIKTNVIDSVKGLDIGQTIYASNLYQPILSANPDYSNPSFFITNVKIDGKDKIEASKFQLLTVDESLITINVSEG